MFKFWFVNSVFKILIYVILILKSWKTVFGILKLQNDFFWTKIIVFIKIKIIKLNKKIQEKYNFVLSATFGLCLETCCSVLKLKKQFTIFKLVIYYLRWVRDQRNCTMILNGLIETDLEKIRWSKIIYNVKSNFNFFYLTPHSII